MKSIVEACTKAGGQAKLAEAISVSPQTVWQWVNNIRPIPADKCVAIEQATGISRLDLYAGDGAALWPEVFAPQKEKATA